ncbi:MAG: cadmium-translocating P-type ATPase [Bdellovibrionales bacterium]|nr:cadmium-translocating P-type ATPase [Bdellovibrionales bacterium]
MNIKVKGMSCASCVGRIEKALKPFDENVTVNLQTETAYVQSNQTDEVYQAIFDAGYSVELVTKQLKVKGMSCSSCVTRVEKALLQIPGVITAEVNLANEKAKVELIDQKINLQDLQKAVKAAGYELLDVESSEEKHEGFPKSLLFGLIIAVVLMLPMLIMPFGIDVHINKYVQLLLATFVQLYFGYGFYKPAIKAVKNKTPNMDVLVSIGTTAAYLLSVYNMTKVNADLYFESAVVILVLVRLGKYLELRAKKQTQKALQSLEKLRPEKAVVLEDGKEITKLVTELKTGDIVKIKPGERIPVDGEVIEGQTSVDESMLTGESLPVEKTKGSNVITGSMNTDGSIKVTVTALGESTALSKIIDLVEQAQAQKAPIQKLVDQVSFYFVPLVLIISLITFLTWWFLTKDLESSLLASVAVLVIACPCALGLATPTAIMVGTGVAAKNGILIQNAEVLEVLHRANIIAFDKTGTLTVGKPQLTTLNVINDKYEKNEVLKILASLQSSSEHPLAQAVLNAYNNDDFYEIENFKAISGKGLQADINGEHYKIGSKSLLGEEHFNSVPDTAETHSFLLKNNDLVAVLGFKDQPREDAKVAISKLRKQNLKTYMLTGDNQRMASEISKNLGLDGFYAELLPEQKVQKIKDLKNNEHDTVAMVGDGVNDAPALASANVGIAMSSGTDVAVHSAGVILMRGETLLVPAAISISKATYKKIQQNLFWAFIFNTIGIPLAAFGWLSPMIAGGAMAFSSVLVLTNSLRLKRWKP